ncbi:MAG: LysR family transcriptional regulator [Oscillospiraceae bacterium]|nr:LysR family transcriptional regulator [Oscillospiraceae bacterium]
MNIKDYEYVLEIARRGSISKAAEKLCITQGALTKYLQRLEHELSTPLFYRSGNRFLPTKAGELYLDKAKQIIDLDHELSEQIASLSSSRDAALRFGYPMGMHAFVMEFLLPAFFAAHPNACVSLKEDSSRSLLQELEEGKLDLCLAYASEKKNALEYEAMATSFMVLAVPTGSALLAHTRKAEGQPYPILEDQAWLTEPYIHLAPHTRSGQAAERYFEQIGRRPQSRLYVDDTRSALAAVEQKLGNCLLTAIPHTDKLVRYLILPELPKEEHQVFLVTRKNEKKSRACQGMIQHARQLYKDF